MNGVEFPISREAAYCGVYIYLGSTRVGLKSKESLRSEYLIAYEEQYRAGLAKRRQRKPKECTSPNNAVSQPEVVETSAGSFLSMVSSLSTSERECVPSGVDLFSIKVSTTTESSGVDTQVSEPEREWVSHGVDLFSIHLEKSATACNSEGESEDIFEDSEEDVFDSYDDVEEFGDDAYDSTHDDWFGDDGSPSEPTGGVGVPAGSPASIWGFVGESVDDEGFIEFSDEGTEDFGDPEDDYVDEPEDITKKPISSGNNGRGVIKPPVGVVNRGEPGVRGTSNHVPEYSSRATTSSKSSLSQVAPQWARLDEGSIREFVRANKMCSESDICKAFSNYDSVKVRACIKSALRKYKIFEKHGKFTV